MSSSFVTNSDYQINLNSGSNTLTVVGNLSVTGNTNIGGNISFNTIQNGNSNVSIPIPNSNVNVSAAGNTWVFGTTGNLTFPTGMQIEDEGANTRISQNSGQLKITAGTSNASLKVGWSELEGTGTGNIAQMIANGTGQGSPGNVTIFTGNQSSTTYSWTFDNTGKLTAPGNITGDNILTAGVVKTGVFVTGNIPTAAGVGAGARAFVTDANSGTFGNLYVGGAANAMPVWSNGTSWYVG
jgi:hypothetical protein